MNIGIFEMQHFEVAYPMIRTLDMPGNHLTIFVNDETHRRLTDLLHTKMDRYTWIIQRPGTSSRSFIATVYKTCKREKLELLFLSTVTAHFIWFAWLAALLPYTKCILTLHDANNFLNSRLSVYPRRTIRHIGKKVLLHFCFSFATTSATVQQHLLASMNVKKKVLLLPGAIFDAKQIHHLPPAGLDPIRLTVAGTIDARRREYTDVFALLRHADEHGLRLHITLAGGFDPTYGKSILHACRDYAKQHGNLIFFETDILEQVKYDTAIQQSHFLWLPSVINTSIADGIMETYGVTKSSGNIFDAIRHAKPLLVPAALSMASDMQGMFYQYNSLQELALLLQTLAASPGKYETVAKEAETVAADFTLQKARDLVKAIYSW